MEHNHSPSNRTSKNIVIAFVLNAIFVVIEIIGGLLTNSIAILSDALHDFGDCISLAIAWGFQKKSNQIPDKSYSYGYKRFSLLSSVFLSGVLLLSSIFVIIEGVKRIIEPQIVDVNGMFWLALIGIGVNGIVALRLKRGDSISEKAVFIHIMEDVLGWIAVLIASIVMKFVNIPVLDPILSIMISIWVLTNVFINIKITFRILLQGTPKGVDLNKLKEDIEQLKEVESIHDLHVWTLDGESHVMTLHVVYDGNNSPQLKQNIIDIAKKYKINHTTTELERIDDNYDENSCN